MYKYHSSSCSCNSCSRKHSLRGTYYDADSVDYIDGDTGSVTIDTSGDPSITIGGGIGIDLVNGDLTEKIAPGISIDLGPDTNTGF